MMEVYANTVRSDAQAENAIINLGEAIKVCREMGVTHQRELAIRGLEKIEVSIELSRDTTKVKQYLQELVVTLKTVRP
ncbi:MAG: hypothetical protein UT41_C0001G0233 [Candidatus Wolfebacteria bacterium GW2011_GWC2_39_22]|uniref:Uncharacterized protein n=1 Tax=Candidatus Wolfebacteria bacterium GW2011_GWC2_39_22 TaxID=1619013 RepID=A0A0G0N954_9BACT|nr:MAG: hypothetical protein UT41_C0001G0233 [Candidatus Wolfebacteria bacterium GW2011_GWC2_39_22]